MPYDSGELSLPDLDPQRGSEPDRPGVSNDHKLGSNRPVDRPSEKGVGNFALLYRGWSPSCDDRAERVFHAQSFRFADC